MSRSLRQSAFAAVVSAAALVFAAPDAPPVPIDPASEIENSRFQFEGEVNANAVYVRSGPSDNDYATMKVDKGAKVIVVGAGKFEWLKILPPEGSFCYVAKAYVEKRGDGKVGRVTNALNVRVGSQLLPMKTKVASKLEPGQDVQIIGEQDEYFKIQPPPGVYLYISKQFVEPVRRVDIPGIADAAAPGGGTAPLAGDSMPAGDSTPAATERPAVADATAPGGISTTSTPIEAGPSDQPAQDQPSNNSAAIADATPLDPARGTDNAAPSPSEIPVAVASDSAPGTPIASPTTRPAAAPAVAVAAELEFDRLETLLREVSAKPVQEQPVPELLAGYEKLAASDALPESMRRQAEYRVSTLKVHNQNRELIMAHERDRRNREQELVALKREGDELVERLKTTGIVFYSAVGTLRPSSLQTGGDGTLYRLTDPVSGRTMVYLRSADPRLISMMGLFVGVQGEIVDDQQWKLKIITPTEIEPVDQRKVNHSITAKLIPPSLMPGGALVGERNAD